VRRTGGPGGLASGGPFTLTFTLYLFCMLAAANGAMALAFTSVAAALMSRRLKTYFTAAPRFRWRLMLAGLALFPVIAGPLIVLSAQLDPKAPEPPLPPRGQAAPGRPAGTGRGG